MVPFYFKVRSVAILETTELALIIYRCITDRTLSINTDISVVNRLRFDEITVVLSTSFCPALFPSLQFATTLLASCALYFADVFEFIFCARTMSHKTLQTKFQRSLVFVSVTGFTRRVIQLCNNRS